MPNALNTGLRLEMEHYINDTFIREDDALRFAKEEAARQGFPAIHIRPSEGLLLHMLARLANARRIVEIGTLSGYSGVWLARALPPEGRLYTLEADPAHAAVARRTFTKAGVTDRVTIIEGPALAGIAKLPDGPFDMVFIDADKKSSMDYLAWAVEHVRPGGLLTIHNALRGGRIINPQSESDEIMQHLSQTVAADPRLTATIINIGDGMLTALVNA